MLEKPDIAEGRLAACLSAAYGLRVAKLAFLPLGADAGTAVYRASTGDGRAYFLKLRRDPFEEISVAVPAFLGELGIEHLIAPIRTGAGQLWVRLEPFTLTLYPFVSGLDGYQIKLTVRQWVAFGATLRQIHAARLPAALERRLPRESYSPLWRERVRMFQAQTQAGPFEDALAAELAATMRDHALEINRLVEAAERLAQALPGRVQDHVLCHADLHAGNLLIGSDGALYLVDWDTARLAPKARDLMFIGSGLGPGWNGAEEAGWFYQGYGPAPVEPLALAYYRCERIVEDIAAFCQEILPATGSGEDRRQGLQYFKSLFRPGGVTDIALWSSAATEAGRVP